MEQVNIKDFKRESRKRKVLAVRDKIVNTGRDLWNNHRTETIAVAVTAAETIKFVSKAVVSHNRKVEEQEKRYRIYDRRSNSYEYYRKPTRREQEEIDYRKRNGERMFDILYDMDLLKR